MNIQIHRLRVIIAIAALALLNIRCFGQGTAFSYQGRLNNNGAPANGVFDFRFRLASDPLASNYVGTPFGVNGVAVTAGLFTTEVDFGAAPFTGNTYWMEVDVRTNGGTTYTVLDPLQPLTPTPYAIFSSGASNVLGVLANSNLPTSPVVSGTITAGSFSGNGSGLTNVNATTLNGLASSNFWKTSGNAGTTPGTDFLGTSDNKSVVVKVNGQQAVRYEPTGDTPNVVGGFSGNSIQSGLLGGTIAGGGTAISSNPNTITGSGNYGAIVGGLHNNVFGYGAGVFGGASNSSGGLFSFIGEGQYNGAYADNSFIGSGYYNNILSTSSNSVISGGFENSIQTNNQYAVIGGGIFNVIFPSASGSLISGGGANVISNGNTYSTIAGGQNNLIGSGASQSVIGGGQLNVMGNGATESVIAGGYQNTVQPFTTYSVIGGGMGNLIYQGPPFNFIGGGISNVAGYGGFTVVGGGENNAAFAPFASIVGGLDNIASGGNSFIGGGSNNFNYAARASIVGGSYNLIDTTSADSLIGGGIVSQIVSNSAQSVIAGGALHILNNSTNAVVGGGYQNIISNGTYATIAGGRNDTIAAQYAAIGGGEFNTVAPLATVAVIGGGVANNIYTNAYVSTIGGGQQNNISNNAVGAAISGGYLNAVGVNAQFATVGGGANNAAYGQYATVPGGQSNIANGNFSFAAGTAAVAGYNNDFVWNDGSAGFVGATLPDQFVVHATNGVGINTGNPQAALHVAGAIKANQIRLGSETGGATASYPDTNGMVIRRVASLADAAAGGIVARTDTLTLERDNSIGGLLIRWTNSPGTCAITAMGVTTNGTVIGFHHVIPNPSTSGTVTVFSTGQNVAHYDITFGDTYSNNHLTRVVLDRYDTDYFIIGTLTSTYNQ